MAFQVRTKGNTIERTTGRLRVQIAADQTVMDALFGIQKRLTDQRKVWGELRIMFSSARDFAKPRRYAGYTGPPGPGDGAIPNDPGYAGRLSFAPRKRGLVVRSNRPFAPLLSDARETELVNVLTDYILGGGSEAI